VEQSHDEMLELDLLLVVQQDTRTRDQEVSQVRRESERQTTSSPMSFTWDETVVECAKAVARYQLGLIAELMRNLAKFMRERESYFSEEAFDELPRMADRLDEFSEKL
jgi:hypothetical protein